MICCRRTSLKKSYVLLRQCLLLINRAISPSVSLGYLRVLCVITRPIFCTVEGFVHAALDQYAFIAITASLSTLNALIEMVQSDNDRRQLAMNDTGIDIRRSLDVSVHLLKVGR